VLVCCVLSAYPEIVCRANEFRTPLAPRFPHAVRCRPYGACVGGVWFPGAGLRRPECRWWCVCVCANVLVFLFRCSVVGSVVNPVDSPDRVWGCADQTLVDRWSESWWFHL
jgi:hypothetical protein